MSIFGTKISQANNVTNNETTNIKASGSDCSRVIADCDKALRSKDEEIKKDEEIIKELDETTKKVTEAALKEEEKLNSPIRNPFLMGGIGAALGMVVGGPFVMGAGLIMGILW